MTDATTPKAIAPPDPAATHHAVAQPGKATHAVIRIRELDALRGIAALLVVLFHFTMFRPQADYGFKYGVTGVDLFFMISGYVIFLTISRVRDWRDFIVSRVARLYPAYWTAVLLTTLLLYAFDRPHFFPRATLANLTMLQNFVGTGDLDGAYWTLAVELIFYGLMLLLFVSGQLRSIETWGAVFLSVLLGFHLTGPLYFGTSYNLIKEYLPFVSHAPLFMSGILFYNLQRHPANGLRHAAIAGCFFFTCYLHDRGSTAMGPISPLEHRLILGLYVGVFYLFIHNQLGFLVNKYTLFLGTISYSLYLIHYTLCVKVIITQLELRGWSLLPASIVALATGGLVAAAITFLIERPANDAIKGWYRKRMSARRGVGNPTQPEGSIAAHLIREMP